MRDFDKEAKDNTRLYNYNFDGVFRKLMLEDFSPYMDLSDTANTLEIGSFDGSMTDQILQHVSFLHVVEPSSEMVSIVESKFPGRVKTFHGTLENIDLGMKFENIFLIHTLEHLDNPTEALAKIRTLLTPSGRLFLAVPNANAISRQIGVHMGLIPNNTAVLESEALQGHLRTYTLDTFRRDIVESGLELEFLSGVFFKAFANFQLDKALDAGIIDMNYVYGANSLAKIYPDLSASLIAVCRN